MIAAIIVIIVSVLLIIPAQMFFPFPWGLGAAFFLLIFAIVMTIKSVRDHNKREKFAEKDLKYQLDEGEPEKEKKNDKSWDGI